jgi:hypothetical protein
VKDEENDDLKEARSGWLEHPYTQAQSRKRAEVAKKAKATFLAACRNTTDPNVARAYAEWVCQDTFAAWMGAA